LVFGKYLLLRLFFVLFLLYVFPAQHRITIGSAYAATERREKPKKQGEKMNGSPSPTPFKRIPPWDALKSSSTVKAFRQRLIYYPSMGKPSSSLQCGFMTELQKSAQKKIKSSALKISLLGEHEFR
jgi:hypothetical protein